MKPDRRISRSSRPAEALSIFLEQARERLGLRALALGTTSGYLIAGSGEDLEQVAERGADVDAGGHAVDMATWRMKLGNTFVLLTSVGGILHPDLGTAIRRILAP